MSLPVRMLVSGRAPVTIEPDDSVQEAAERLTREGVGLLVVVDGDRVLGVVSDRDLALRVAAIPGTSADAVSVESVMSAPAEAVPVDAPLDDAVRKMCARGLRRLVVVDRAGRPVGVLAQSDVLHALARELGDLVGDPARRTAEARREARLQGLRDDLSQSAERLAAELRRATWLSREALSDELGALRRRLEHLLRLPERDE